MLCRSEAERVYQQIEISTDGTKRGLSVGYC